MVFIPVALKSVEAVISRLLPALIITFPAAAGKVIIKAGSSLEMTASTDFKATGMNTTVSASQALKTSGQVSAEISASGNTVVKGAMVMIN